MKRGFSLKKPTEVDVDISFVVDYEISKIFKFNKKRIMAYCNIMLCSVNNRFHTLNDPKVTFKFVGIYSIDVRHVLLLLNSLT